MVVGVGIDIVEVARIAHALRRPQFARKLLTEHEEAYCTNAAGVLVPSRVAGRWAAKEAVVKAVGVTYVLSQIEILNDPLGQPHVRIHNPHFDSTRLRIYLSITHERNNAAAVAVVERIVLQRPAV